MKIKSIAILVMAVFTIVYLIGSFVAWDINPSHWPGEGRLMIVVFGVFLLLIISGIINDSKKDLYK